MRPEATEINVKDKDDQKNRRQESSVSDDKSRLFLLSSVLFSSCRVFFSPLVANKQTSAYKNCKPLYKRKYGKYFCTEKKIPKIPENH